MVSGGFVLLSYNCVCGFCAQLSANFLKITFFKKRGQIFILFFNFSALSLTFEFFRFAKTL